jgi:hypothetical protein
MKTWYVYFYRSDTSSEPIGRIYAESLESAKTTAALIKDLPVTEFIKIFDVKLSETELQNENDVR